MPAHALYDDRDVGALGLFVFLRVRRDSDGRTLALRSEGLLALPAGIMRREEDPVDGARRVAEANFVDDLGPLVVTEVQSFRGASWAVAFVAEAVVADGPAVVEDACEAVWVEPSEVDPVEWHDGFARVVAGLGGDASPVRSGGRRAAVFVDDVAREILALDACVRLPPDERCAGAAERHVTTPLDVGEAPRSAAMRAAREARAPKPDCCALEGVVSLVLRSGARREWRITFLYAPEPSRGVAVEGVFASGRPKGEAA